MWMDVAITAIILISAAFGFRSGFVKTFLHTIGWLLSIVLGFIWYPQLKTFLMDHTNYYVTMRDHVGGRLSDAAGSAIDESFANIPDVLRQVFSSATESFSTSLADTITNLFFSIITFVIIIVLIKLIFWLLIQLFSKTKNEGFTGMTDGLLGFGFGALKGLFLILVLMALLVPVSNFADTGFFTDSIAKSTLGAFLYNDNPLLWFSRSLL